MGKLVLSYSDYNEAKRNIKKFSEQSLPDVEFSSVNSSKDAGEWFAEFFLGGGIGGDHKVTGAELNTLAGEVQDKIIFLNKKQLEITGEFFQVYCALEALDSKYVPAILSAIDNIDTVNTGLKKTQDALVTSIKDQKATIDILSKFRGEIKSYKHLRDIDGLWEDLQKLKSEANGYLASIDTAVSASEESVQKADAAKEIAQALEETIADLSNQIEQQQGRIDTLIAFTDEMEKLVHLQDVDRMWLSLSSATEFIHQLEQELTLSQNAIQKQQVDINMLLDFMKKLSAVSHLKDVDKLWNDNENARIRAREIEAAIKGHDERLEELQRQNADLCSKEDESAENIRDLQEYRSSLQEFVHLSDIDSIWESVQDQNKQLDTLKEQGVELNETAQTNKKVCDDAIAKAAVQTDTAMEALTRKITYSYWIAGGAVFLAASELVYLLVRMI